MSRGHGKGSEFERAVCKFLSKWWTHGERDDIFWRSSTSGARAKTRSKTGQKTFGQYGDIQASDPIGQPLIDFFTFELKIGYNHVSVTNVLEKGPKSAKQEWEKWVEQVMGDHQNARSYSWALITKRDRREPLIFIPHGVATRLIDLNQHPQLPPDRFIITTENFGRISAFPLNKFIKIISPELIIKAIELIGV